MTQRNSIAMVSQRRTGDPLVATYLEQIRQRPLLSKDEEQELALRMRRTRNLFRRAVLTRGTVLNDAVALLEQVCNGTMRFDRAINIGVREKTKKAKELRALSEALPRLNELLRLINKDSTARLRQTKSNVKRQSRLRARRKEAIELIERFQLRLPFFERWWQGLLRDRLIPKQKAERIHGVYVAFQACKRKLADHNVRLVVSIAKRYTHPEMSLLDLIQEGNIGLMAAVEKFDAERNLRFSTYATFWIIQMIRKAIVEKTRSVRLPIAAADRLDKAVASISAKSQSLGRRLTCEESEGAGQYRGEEFRWIPCAALPTVSLDQTMGTSDDYALHESLVQVREDSPAEVADRSEIRRILHDVLSRWTPRERDIIKLRYGLESPKSHTLEEVGSKLRMSRERVRQIEKASLARLREQLAFVQA